MDAPKPFLIGLYSSVMQSGKSEVANAIRRLRPGTVEPVNFASPLKAMADTLLREMGYPEMVRDEMLYGNLKEVQIPAGTGYTTPRKIMQHLGTDWGRQMIADNLWVSIAIRKAERFRQSGFSVVVDDMRFPNEYHAIKDAGGIVICVARPGASLTSEHPSEGALDDFGFDYTITNDGTLKDLEAKTKAVLTEIVRRQPV